MRDYWSCGKFADWLRGTPKIKCGTSEEWDAWYKQAAQNHPIRYWIAEEGLDKLQSLWCWIPERFNDARYYINNRFVSRTNSLTAHPRDIKPGQWQDVGNRFLPCLFNELVDFVENKLECRVFANPYRSCSRIATHQNRTGTGLKFSTKW